MREHTPPWTWREFLLHALVLCVLLFALFPRTFTRAETILPGGLLFESPPWSRHMPEDGAIPKNWLTGEALFQFHKFYVMTRELLDAGEWPLWNHREFFGMPLLANYQCTPFYPPRLLHAFLDIAVATTLYTLLKFWLCGMTAYLCARSIRLDIPAARFASFGWMLASYNLSWVYWCEPDVSAWLPVLFMSAEFLVDNRIRRGFCGMALGAVLLLLAGHPESAFAAGMGIGLYFFLRLASERPRGARLWKPVAAAGAAWTVALLVCSVQLLPFLEYVPQSLNAAERVEADLTKRFIPFGGLAAFFVPRFYGVSAEGNYWARVDPHYINSSFVNFIYPGIAVWFALATLCIRRGHAPAARRRACCLAITAAAGILMTLNLPGVRIIQQFSLLDSMWRCWYYVYPAFALPLLGAMGIDHWWRERRRLRDLWPFAAVTLIAVAVIAFLYGLHAPVMRALDMDAYVRVQMLVSVGVALAALALCATALTRRVSPRIPVAVLTALLAADLVFAARDLIPTAPRSWIFPRTELTDYLRGLPQPARVGAVTSGIGPGFLPVYGIEQLWGSDGIYPRKNIELLGRLGLPTAEVSAHVEPLCSVDVYLHYPENPPMMPFDDPDRFTRLATLDGVEVYRNRRALPRAFLVGDSRVVASEEEMFEALLDPGFDPARTALLEAPPPAGLPAPAAESPGTAEIAHYAAHEVRVVIDARHESILVLTDAFYPGWRAVRDGAAVDLFPVNHTFRGVIVPAGRSEVVFRFRPWSFRAGLLVSTLTLLAALSATLLLVLRAARRAPSRPR